MKQQTETTYYEKSDTFDLFFVLAFVILSMTLVASLSQQYPIAADIITVLVMGYLFIKFANEFTKLIDWWRK